MRVIVRVLTQSHAYAEALFLVLLSISPVVVFEHAAIGQAGPQGGKSSQSSDTADPFGVSFSQDLTFSSKAIYSSKRDLNFSLNGTWVFKGIGIRQQDGNIQEVETTTPLQAKWEYLLASSDEYDDTWKAALLSSTVTQKYGAAFDVLRAICHSTCVGKYWGVIGQAGINHDNTQGVQVNPVVGLGVFRQYGVLDVSLQGDQGGGTGSRARSEYLLVGAEIVGNFVSLYPPGHTQNSPGLYLLLRQREDWGRSFESTLSTTLTLPFENTSNTIQSAVDAKITYKKPSKNCNYQWGLSLETVFDYYGIAPPSYDTNSVTPSMGLTFSWQQKNASATCDPKPAA
jgi:hypothetical protein